MNIFLPIAIVVVLIAVYFFIFRKKKNFDSLNLVLLSVRLPRITNEENKKDSFLNQINLSEQLFASLTSISEPFSFEVSVKHSEQQIFFYISVPRKSVDFAMRQIQGLFPDAKVDQVPDYTIFGPGSFAAVAELTLKDDFILPIRTYKEAEVDTFAPIISTLSKLEEVGEGASIQIVLKPVGKEVKESIVVAIEKLKSGKAIKDILRDPSIIKGIGKGLGEFMFGSSGRREGDEAEKSPKFIDDEAIKALNMKSGKQLFMANVRLVASGHTRDSAEDILLGMAGAFSQFSAPLRNEIKIFKPSAKKLKSELFRYTFREFNKDSSIILNTEELASIFHLPTSSTDVPRIWWLKSKEAPPPENLPKEGVILGESIFRGDRRLIRMTDEDRRRHLYIIGQTGTGKSVTLTNLIVQDMKNGKGVCVIDPHGSLISDILALVPKERIDDVIVFDPGDLTRPLGLNMLEYDLTKPEQKTFIINEIQAIFNRLFSKESMGPMFERYMRNSLELLMEDAKNEPATLMEIPRLFTDDAFRERKLARITNPSVIDFWEKEAAKTTGDWSLANMVGYIASKFDNFISNHYMRPIIGQTKSAFNFRQVMDDGKILLVNLSKGKIGDINSSLLGMIITGKLLQAALSRQDLIEKGQKDFKDFYLYIDEFQNYTTDSISVILSEARKYRLNLILAHQFIQQLDEKIRDSVFGNVGSMLAFRVGAPDTEVLLKQFSPEFNEKDLISIDNLNCFGKILIGGQPSRPFNMKISFPESGNSIVREKLKELSRLTYGRDASEVENEVVKRLRG
ncbi:MAG: hypothetical protein UT05_C0003G0097 [Parcubacteria group bacterium GW2011_GWF2_38_76]|nr:MAG: hypothetical protein UT05_C0003G0097 [Parcubacteria group bacterium GW2011_GWF2_38_76]HBM46130.1 hypothetical protein [Patescibacteria group bacterium]